MLRSYNLFNIVHAAWRAACVASFSADTRTKSGQAIAGEDAEVNAKEHAALLKQQNKQNELNKRRT